MSQADINWELATMRRELEQIAVLCIIDTGYCFGKPKTYLTPVELAWLTILRSKLGETRGERKAEAQP